ncbi:Ribulose bisphosphate carboxylase small chain, domain-containing protein [Cynara cardunculus var. scolymus]|uniref:Ribulose bisphosphate carboxylase small chain, domain-containing protein n=1 Tax=Cynara cardunculus var. scolymus TaxID=59895 RepID=A0A103XB40_CYNCS|nr:Ribulose bisphosphate carboxylase small chain, domain-containing protein [Cynara cardunculus var. scolymus]
MFAASSVVIRIFRMSGCICMGLNPNALKLFHETNRKTVSNGSRIHFMKKFETISYLPPLTDDSIAKEIDYMMKKGWVGYIFRENSRLPNYYDGRYWMLRKLPMFGCSDVSQVLNEMEYRKAYPNAYIRCLAFDMLSRLSVCLCYSDTCFPMKAFCSVSFLFDQTFSSLLNVFFFCHGFQ